MNKVEDTEIKAKFSSPKNRVGKQTGNHLSRGPVPRPLDVINLMPHFKKRGYLLLIKGLASQLHKV